MVGILTLPVPPTTNHYNNYRAVKGVVIAYPSPKYKKYKEEVIPLLEQFIKDNNWECVSGKWVKVKQYVFLKDSRCDTHNLWKCPLDTMQGYIFDNDRMVIVEDAEVYTDKDNPRIIYEIQVLDKIGVFDDEEERICFLNDNCLICKKNTATCKTLKDLDNNKIHDIDLEDFSCKKIKL